MLEANLLRVYFRVHGDGVWQALLRLKSCVRHVVVVVDDFLLLALGLSKYSTRSNGTKGLCTKYKTASQKPAYMINT